jgi:hypothetical protein
MSARNNDIAELEGEDLRVITYLRQPAEKYGFFIYLASLNRSIELNDKMKIQYSVITETWTNPLGFDPIHGRDILFIYYLL